MNITYHHHSVRTDMDHKASNMNEQLFAKIRMFLAQVEADHQIKILLAVETGARVYNLQAPESDFDIRVCAFMVSE